MSDNENVKSMRKIIIHNIFNDDEMYQFYLQNKEPEQFKELVKKATEDFTPQLTEEDINIIIKMFHDFEIEMSLLTDYESD